MNITITSQNMTIAVIALLCVGLPIFWGILAKKIESKTPIVDAAICTVIVFSVYAILAIFTGTPDNIKPFAEFHPLIAGFVTVVSLLVGLIMYRDYRNDRNE